MANITDYSGKEIGTGLSLNNYTVDTSTVMNIIGQGVNNYSQKVSENFMYLLSNFSGPYPAGSNFATNYQNNNDWVPQSDILENSKTILAGQLWFQYPNLPVLSQEVYQLVYSLVNQSSLTPDQVTEYENRLLDVYQNSTSFQNSGYLWLMNSEINNSSTPLTYKLTGFGTIIVYDITKLGWIQIYPSSSTSVENLTFENVIGSNLNFYTSPNLETITSSISVGTGTDNIENSAILTINSKNINLNGNVNLLSGGQTTTPVTTDNSTNVATTAYVQNNLENYLPLKGSSNMVGDLIIEGNSISIGSHTETSNSSIFLYSSGTENYDSSIYSSGGETGLENHGTLNFQSNNINFNQSGVLNLTNNNGSVVATTLATNDNSTNVATTAYVQNNLENYLPLTGGTMKGNISFSNKGSNNYIYWYDYSTGTNITWSLNNNTDDSFSIERYNSDLLLDSPLSINNSTGVATFLHIPVSVTPVTTDNSTNVATTAYVQNNLENYLPLTGGTITNDLTINGSLNTSGTIQMNYNGSTTDNNIYFHSAGGTVQSSLIFADGGTSGTENSGNISILATNITLTGSGVVNLSNGNGSVVSNTPETTDSSNKVATTNFVTSIIALFLPKGFIAPYYGNLTDLDTTIWAYCDGTNGTPDLRGQYLVGAASSTTTVGASSGSSADYATSTDDHVLTIDEMPAHTHDTGFVNSGLWANESGNLAHIGSSQSSSTGGNSGHNHTITLDRATLNPASISVYYIMKIV